MNTNYKTKPLPHQLEAIDFIANNVTSAVFDEQGLGKTKELIDAISILLSKKVIDGALIICPKTLIHNWDMEIKNHSYLKAKLITGNSEDKNNSFLSYANVYVTNYESLTSLKDLFKLLLKTRKFSIVLDESHRIKNPNSVSFKNLMELKDYSVHRVILTGTPVANDLSDLWAQFYFLDSGLTLGNDFNKFCTEVKNLNEETLDSIKKRISEKSIRRLKKNVLELPDKNYILEFIKLEGQQLDIYEKLKNDLIIELSSYNDEMIKYESKNILTKLLRLLQIASNPSLVTNNYSEVPAKFLKLDNIIEGIIERNEKAIIWTSFVDNIKILKNRYKNLNPLNISGDIPIETRKKYVKLFQENEEFKLIIANPAAAKEGLTLTKANNVIYLDRTFNLVDYLQSQDRIHRISQTKLCNIYKLVALDTADVYVEDKLTRKKDIANYVQGDVSVLVSDTEYLTKEEIFAILN